MCCSCCGQRVIKKLATGVLVCTLCGLTVFAEAAAGHSSPAKVGDHTHEQGGIPRPFEVFQVHVAATTASQPAGGGVVLGG